jgi:CheY-like chemotaxis protein
MSDRPTEQYTVALQGFSDFERSSLTSFFRLASKRSPGYQQVADLNESDFVIADADQGSALQAVVSAHRQLDTVFVGSRAPEGAACWVRRPIEPTHIVRELDSMVALRVSASTVSLSALAAEAAAETDVVEVDEALGLASARPQVGLGVGGNAPVDEGAPRVPSIAAFFDEDAPGPPVLVAEDSRIARRFLQMRLQRLGYRVYLASDGDEALEQITQQPFELVFLDVALGSPGSIDGLAICQHLKQHPDFAGGRAPRVIFVTGMSGASDRVRGRLAGCDAYLTKPLHEAEFMKTLHSLDPELATRRPEAAR